LKEQRLQPAFLETFGHSLQRLGRLAEAAEVYRRWIDYDPENPRPRHHLAACTQEGIPSRASDDYVRQVFDRFSLSFDKCLAELEYAAPRLVVDAAAAELQDRDLYDVALDAGCGTGLCGPGLKPLARRLVGVDLSPGMLEKARKRECYDEIVQAELTEFLSSSVREYDLIVAADVLEYFGELGPVLCAAAGALQPAGCLVFTVEKGDTEAGLQGYSLQQNGRYCHTDDYLKHILNEARLHVRCCRDVFLRHEGHDEVRGWLVVARATEVPTD
jgi:predicted TPR repeat methyltransferase